MMERVECKKRRCNVEFASYKGKREYCTKHRTKKKTTKRGPTTKGSTYNTRHGKSFKNRREWVLSVHQRSCVECGVTNQEHKEDDDLWPPGGGLHIHHIEEARNFDDMSEAHSTDNLVPLCDACHKKVTHGKKSLDVD